MRRRQFLTLLGGVAAMDPRLTRAQPSARVRRVAVLMYLTADDPESKRYVAALTQGLQDLGWVAGRNVRLDVRFTGGDTSLARKYAAELIGLGPDVIVAAGGSHVGPLQQLTRSVPIVFVQVTDPVGGGFVANLARPGGNTTGFTVFEFDISAKWLELLKQIAPRTKRVGVLRDPANPSGTGLFGAIQAVAPNFGVEVSPIGLRDAGEIERGVSSFASTPSGGLVITPSGLAINNRDVIIGLASRFRLPAVYPFRDFVVGGGLLSYGPVVVDQYKRAAGYVDRILKGEKPADLPVQRSATFELVINLRTARALDVEVPQSLALRADELIR